MAGSFELATRNSSAWLPNPVSLSSDKTGVLLLVSHQQAAEKAQSRHSASQHRKSRYLQGNPCKVREDYYFSSTLD